MENLRQQYPMLWQIHLPQSDPHLLWWCHLVQLLRPGIRSLLWHIRVWPKPFFLLLEWREIHSKVQCLWLYFRLLWWQSLQQKNTYVLQQKHCRRLMALIQFAVAIQPTTARPTCAAMEGFRLNNMAPTVGIQAVVAILSSIITTTPAAVECAIEDPQRYAARAQSWIAFMGGIRAAAIRPLMNTQRASAAKDICIARTWAIMAIHIAVAPKPTRTETRSAVGTATPLTIHSLLARSCQKLLRQAMRKSSHLQLTATRKTMMTSINLHLWPTKA